MCHDIRNDLRRLLALGIIVPFFGYNHEIGFVDNDDNNVMFLRLGFWFLISFAMVERCCELHTELQLNYN